MPRPRLPGWKQIDGTVGTTLKQFRDVVSGILDQDHLFGNHVQVTFTGAGVATKVATGLPGPTHGYRIEKASADVRVWDATPPSGITIANGVAYLQASGAATVTVYFY